MSLAATNWALHELRGVGKHKIIMVALCDYADEEGRAWPSQERLAADCEVSVSTVRRALRSFEEMGLLTSTLRWVVDRKGNSHRATSVYQVNIGAQPRAAEPAQPLPAPGEAEAVLDLVRQAVETSEAAEADAEISIPVKMTGIAEPVDNSQDDLPVNLTGRCEPVDNSSVDNSGEPGLFVANTNTGQNERYGSYTGQNGGLYRSPVTGISIPNHQIEPPDLTSPNLEGSPDARDALSVGSGQVGSGVDELADDGPGADAPATPSVASSASAAGSVLSASSPADAGPVGLDAADADLVLACLPEWMHAMDAEGARLVAGMLRERLAAGWTPEQIRDALTGQPPVRVYRLSKLVEHRLRMNVLLELAPGRAAVASLRQRRDTETARQARARARSEALAEPVQRRDSEADRRWAAAMERARAEMPGATHLDVARYAHRLLENDRAPAGASAGAA